MGEGHSLRRSYTFFAPIYDALLARATRPARLRSLGWLANLPPGDVLLAGVGTGLDLPHLPLTHRYVGLDLTLAMLRHCAPRAGPLRFAAIQGDVMAQPFGNSHFDAVVLHLILAVAPEPLACLREASRILRPGGTVLIFDKFLRPGQRAPARRWATPLVKRFATRLDVVLEDLLAECPDLIVQDDQPALARGWFRLVRLKKAQ
ncbi:MAG: class I SAM-dependent methyltransferase [Zoogloeaceae bacterium]|nr:class I SAM-dependent methyltransferase [Zoogloeaceae bacterium]